MAKSADAFRTISEVAEILETPTHVLRFWESKFSQIKPVKRAGGRRYYRPADISLLIGIKQLLHEDGLTIRGVQKLLREQGVKHVVALGEGSAAPVAEAPPAEEAIASSSAKPAAPRPRAPAKKPDDWRQASFFDEAQVPDAPAVPEAPMAIDVPIEDDIPAPAQVVSLIVGTPPEAPAPAPSESNSETDPIQRLRMGLSQVEPGSLSAAEQTRLLALRDRAAALRDQLHQPPRAPAQS